jgi:NAD(P) transhydrogenase subunit alpha
VRSMGATFIELELESLEGSGGYAREMSEERAAKQRELLKPFITKSNVVITTAAVPNRKAPLLVTKEMYSDMAPGSVIVDLAAESGGNVEGSIAGETITTKAGVAIWGGKDVPSQLPFHASSLYSKNLVNLLGLIIKSEAQDGKQIATIHLDFGDEIIEASAVTHDGVKRK